MARRDEVVNTLKDEKIMCIFRGGKMSYEDLQNCVLACKKAGAHLIEITYSHDEPKKSLDYIAKLKKQFGDSMFIGAGTVLRISEAKEVIDSGGDFNVAPTWNMDVLKYTHENDRMCMPGVATATEAVEAYDAGADFLKLFPALAMGFDYAQALMKPLNFPNFFAVCKMTEENFERCLTIGFAGAGISSRINSPEIIENKQFDLIEQRVEHYLEISRKYGNSCSK